MNTLFDLTEFFGRPLHKEALTRNDIGAFAEEFACRTLGMERQQISGGKSVCEDARWDGAPVEVKSVGLNGRALIYRWRLQKEEEVFGPSYAYVFVSHTCPITVKHGTQIVESFAASPPAIYITTLRTLRAAIGTTPSRKFSWHDKSYPDRTGRMRVAGFSRAGYDLGGWQFPLSKLPIARCVTVSMTLNAVALSVPVLYTDNE
jgi:hypothetical protein